MIAIHIRKNSPKQPDAKFSIYLQRRRIGVSWRRRACDHPQDTREARAGMHLWVRTSGGWKGIHA